MPFRWGSIYKPPTFGVTCAIEPRKNQCNKEGFLKSLSRNCTEVAQKRPRTLGIGGAGWTSEKPQVFQRGATRWGVRSRGEPLSFTVSVPSDLYYILSYPRRDPWDCHICRSVGVVFWGSIDRHIFQSHGVSGYFDKSEVNT